MNIYIAGPMTGYADHNFPAFDAAQARFEAQGYRVLSPAQLDRAVGVFEDTVDLPENFLREAILRDVMTIFFCKEIHMLRGWESSKGARAEKALAEWLGMKVSYES